MTDGEDVIESAVVERRRRVVVSTVGVAPRRAFEKRLEESLEWLVITGNDKVVRDVRLTCVHTIYANPPRPYLSAYFCLIFELPSLL